MTSTSNVAGWIVACALVLGAHGARAQDCESDADCNSDGKVCEQFPDVRECVWKGCADDADCPDGFACTGNASEGDDCISSVDGGCPEPEASEPTGECRPQPVACSTDSDCPNGLRCMDECLSSDADDETCMPGASVCWFAALEQCDSDADCAAEGFACLVSEREERCTGSASVCRPGAECSEEDLAPRDAGCEMTERRACLPARVDCSDDADCDPEWSCFTLPDPDEDDNPEEWTGATQLCFPEGWTLALEEQIEAGALGQSASDSGGGKGFGEGAGIPRSGGDGGTDADGASGEDDDGGCSISPAPSRGRPGLPGLALIGLAWWLARRRR